MIEVVVTGRTAYPTVISIVVDIDGKRAQGTYTLSSLNDDAKRDQVATQLVRQVMPIVRLEVVGKVSRSLKNAVKDFQA